MATIKLLEFTPDASFSLGNKTLYFEDAPGGMSYSMEHLNPVNSRRTQDGTLITQSIRFNKKIINLSISVYDIVTQVYFQTLYESGYRTALTIWTEDSTYTEISEFTGTVQIISFSTDNDQTNNSRTLNLILSEV